MIKKMTDSDYFRHPALSQSQFKNFLDSPLKYQHAKKSPPTVSKAFSDGSAIHCFALEPHLFEETFAVWDGDFRSKESKEWKAEQESNGLTVVKEKDIEDYKRMGEKLYEGLRLDLVPSSQKELAAFTNICGVPCRGKGDLLDNDGFLWDIKTAASLKLRDGIWYNMFDYRYDIQAMWYLLLFAEVKPKGFRFAVIEKKAPYDWVKLEVGMDILIRAKQHIKDGLESYKTCVARKDWPGYTKDIQTISLPPYLS